MNQMKYSKVVLLIRHPNIDPEVISHELGLTPYRSWKVGEPRFTPKGTALSGVWKDSCWNHVFRTPGDIAFLEWVNTLVSRLYKHREFFSQLSSGGGDIFLNLGLPGIINQGGNLYPPTLRMLSDMEMSLGVEVFPDWVEEPS